MDFGKTESTVAVWLVRFGLVGTIIGGLWVGFQKYQAHEDNTFHRVEAAPKVDDLEAAVTHILEDSKEQRTADEKFRKDALSSIGSSLDKVGETMGQHGERIERLEDFDKEQIYYKRAEQESKAVAERRLEALEDEQRLQRAAQTEALNRPVEVIIAPPTTPDPAP